MAVRDHLPPLHKLSQEFITQFFAVLAVAWVISKTQWAKDIMASAHSLSALDNPPQ